MITLIDRDRRPVTFSHESLNELGTLLRNVRYRATAGEFVGVVLPARAGDVSPARI
ncbi:hypothetical protein [Arthrobacter sp. P2b]|uniref:hypothetical protein n=1 Tax=Arthrobacter sp. P2b TaxID=1938741 RepID=UPI001591DC81|nr:hypothetical protein [Arthrobacter sp. P2b]